METRAYSPIFTGPYRLVHGGDYNPEQWRYRPEILAEDPRLMRLARINGASVAIFAWAALEPADGSYDFDWLDEAMDRLHAAGIGVFLATPTAARPRWLAEAHPEVMPLRRSGQREAPGNGRHNFCRSSPVYRRHAERIIDRLAERYAGHPALIGWHLNNEYAGAEDADRCYCDGCLDGFRAWLRNRYHDDLDALNRAWWTSFWSHTYTSWEQIRPGDHAVEALQLNWHRFASAQMADWCGFEAAAVRRRSRAPITTNLHGGLAGFDHGALAAHLDFVSYDSYPNIDGGVCDRDQVQHHAWLADATRGFKPGRPWLLMESCPGQPQYKSILRCKRPGVHRALSLAMVAHGSDGVCYFQWRAGRGGMEKLHGAVLMQDAPYDTRIFREVAALGRDLEALSGVAGAATPAEVAVLWDVESEWARGWNSGLQTLPKPAELSRCWHRPCWEAGFGVEVVDAARDLAGYRLIVVPGVFLLRPGFAERLTAAARAGAQVLIDPLSAWIDDDFNCVGGGRPGPLREALGVRSEEFDQLRADEAVPLDDPQGFLPVGAQAIGWVDRTHSDGCEVLATCRDSFHAGWPALTRRACGAGAFWYLAAGLDAAGRAHLLGRLAGIAGVRPCLPDLPPGIIARERRQPDRRFIFLANYGEGTLTAPLPGAGWACAISGRPVSGSIAVELWQTQVLVQPNQAA